MPFLVPLFLYLKSPPTYTRNIDSRPSQCLVSFPHIVLSFAGKCSRNVVLNNHTEIMLEKLFSIRNHLKWIDLPNCDQLISETYCFMCSYIFLILENPLVAYLRGNITLWAYGTSLYMCAWGLLFTRL